MDAVQKVGNGHPGTAMSLAPAAYLLFQKVMRHNPADPHWPGRDRFVLSCGHSSLTLYIQLYLGGWGLELEDLKSLRTWGSKTPGHPEYGHTAGVETTTGPLGQGVGNAVGMAMAARRERGLLDPNAADGRVAVRPPHLRDGQRRRPRGGRQRRGLLDRRHPAARQPHPDLRRQPDLDRGRHRHRASPRTSPQRYEAYGWHVQTVDWTHGGTQLPARTCRRSTTRSAGAEQVTDQPSFIVLRTIIAWPAPNAQNTGKAHGSALGDDEVAATKKILGFDPEQTFEVAAGRPRAHPRGSSSAARPRRPSGRRAYDAWAAQAVRRRRPLRAAADPHPARRAGPTTCRRFPADEKGVATRKASGEVINAIAAESPSCGAARPTSPSPTTPPSRARRRSSRRTAPTKMWKGDPLRRPGAALRHPRARHGRDHERHRRCTAAPASSAARS